jgi:hypothetical protein
VAGCIVIVAFIAGIWFVNLDIAGCTTIATIGIIVCVLVAIAAAVVE